MRRLTCLLATALLTVAAGCAPSDNPPPPAPTGDLRSVALADREPAGGPLFELLDPAATGVTFANRFDWDNPRKNLYMHGYACGGACIGDYDEDGRPDIYLVSQVGRDALYRQTGDFRFEEASDRAGLAAELDWGTGASFADVDGDGDLDLYVCNYDAPNLLYVNQGDGTFTEAAAHAGLDFRGASIQSSFADYDLDGDLDVFLLTNRLYPGPDIDVPHLTRTGGRPMIADAEAEAFAIQMRPIDGKEEPFLVKAGQRDRLYRNDGRGTFIEVAQAAGITGNHPGLSATWWDYNGDGRPDLYVANDFWDPDRLYRNDGDGTFTDVLPAMMPHTPWFSMGSDLADVNNDGLVDFLASDMSATTHYMSKLMMGNMNDSRWFLLSAEPRQYMRNALYLNTGTERFMEIAFLAGVASTDWTWSVKFGDLDNDGWVDLYVTNGTSNHSFDPDLTAQLQTLGASLTSQGISDPKALWELQWRLYRTVPPRREAHLAFRNRGDLRFEETGAAWGLRHEGIAFGAAYGDLDRDGDLDLVVNNVDDPASVYRNRGSAGHRVLLELEGTSSNRFGLGAAVTLQTAAGRQVRWLTTTRGYMSADEPIIHFGLGDQATIETLKVRWPSGRVQRFSNLAADRLYQITEPAAPAPAPAPGNIPAPPPLPAPRFRESAVALGLPAAVRPERPYDDFARQPLLPAVHSQLGPGLAFGDVDSDGDDDLFLGGPAWQTGRLLLRGDDGTFRDSGGGPWAADIASEDMTPLFLDADSDGDLDLYVGSGSVECEPGDPVLRGRLYVNDGIGRFSRSPPEALPDDRDSTAAAAAADWDLDGDLDLFVGGRVIPGQYPQAPVSRLLRNDGGRFTDVTVSLAPGLESIGMVTSALWSDADNDSRLDLLLALEWGPVSYWRNAGDHFEDRTAEAGLAERSGWWNSIAGGDLDADGDIDYVVLNAGLNTKYRASPDHPAHLFLGDFDGTGRRQLVEAKSGAGHELPVRGLSCLSDAMPFVRQVTPTFRDFAGSTLEDIFGKGLPEAEVWTATHLESGVLLNQGGTFEYRALPRLAQASPGYGAAIADLDGDGRADVVIAQNFFGREPETGHWDGGLGLLLRGDGAGGLTPVWPAESGIVIDGPATGLALCDSDGDGRPDVAVTRNNARPLLFHNDGPGDFLAVRLSGPAGNPAGIGARVTMGAQTAEVYAGSGYLSQSAPILFFGSPGGAAAEIRVRWPGGRTSVHTVPAGTTSVRLAAPGA